MKALRQRGTRGGGGTGRDRDRDCDRDSDQFHRMGGEGRRLPGPKNFSATARLILDDLWASTEEPLFWPREPWPLPEPDPMDEFRGPATRAKPVFYKYVDERVRARAARLLYNELIQVGYPDIDLSLCANEVRLWCKSTRAEKAQRKYSTLGLVNVLKPRSDRARYREERYMEQYDGWRTGGMVHCRRTAGGQDEEEEDTDESVETQEQEEGRKRTTPTRAGRSRRTAGGRQEEDSAGLPEEDLQGRTMAELKDLLKVRGLPVNGRKADLVEMLLVDGEAQAMQQEAAEEEEEEQEEEEEASKGYLRLAPRRRKRRRR